MTKLKLAPRARTELETIITVHYESGGRAIEYGPDEIADVKINPTGALEIFFIDWSYITYGPAWKWIVREKQ